MSTWKYKTNLLKLAQHVMSLINEPAKCWFCTRIFYAEFLWIAVTLVAELTVKGVKLSLFSYNYKWSQNFGYSIWFIRSGTYPWWWWIYVKIKSRHQNKSYIQAKRKNFWNLTKFEMINYDLFKLTFSLSFHTYILCNVQNIFGKPL